MYIFLCFSKKSRPILYTPIVKFDGVKGLNSLSLWLKVAIFVPSKV
jgi:hypothetical protein